MISRCSHPPCTGQLPRGIPIGAFRKPTIQMISAVSLGPILWRGGIKVELGAITIGGLQKRVSYIMMILWPIQDLAHVYADIPNRGRFFERVFSLIDTQPTASTTGRIPRQSPLWQEILLSRMSFRYEEDEPVIRNLSFYIPYGQSVAWLDRPAAGKRPS